MFKKQFHIFHKRADIGSLLIFTLIIVTILVLWSGGAWYLTEVYFLEDPVKAGQMGDTFGVVNSLFSGLTFAGLVYTILLQRKELKETRDEFVQQNTTLRLQRFENTLFNLLTARNNLLSSIKGIHVDHRHKQHIPFEGRELFMYANSNLDDRLRNFDLSGQKEFSDELVNSLREAYDGAVKTFANHLDLYLSNLTTLLKFIRKSELLNSDMEREFYFSIVRSQMSVDERRFIYYYMGMADPTKIPGRYVWETRNTEIEYKFNQFSREFLFDQSHVKLQNYWGGFLNYNGDE